MSWSANRSVAILALTVLSVVWAGRVASDEPPTGVLVLKDGTVLTGDLGGSYLKLRTDIDTLSVSAEKIKCFANSNLDLAGVGGLEGSFVSGEFVVKSAEGLRRSAASEVAEIRRIDPQREETPAHIEMVSPVGDGALEASGNWYAAFNGTYVDQATRGNHSYHTGIDLGGTFEDTVVVAAAAGEVVQVIGLAPVTGCTKGNEQRRLWDDKDNNGKVDVGELQALVCTDQAGRDNHGYGISVVIRHDNGLYSQYSHLAAVKKEVWEGAGDCPAYRVNKGEAIGVVGGSDKTTLNSSAMWPHLHFEVKDILRPDLSDKFGLYWGYTPDLPSAYGYRDPLLYLRNGSPLTPQVLEPPLAIRIDGSESCNGSWCGDDSRGTRIYAGAGVEYAVLGWSGKGGGFVADAKVTRTETCPGPSEINRDWYRINIPNERGPGVVRGWIPSVSCQDRERPLAVHDPSAQVIAIAHADAANGEPLRQHPGADCTRVADGCVRVLDHRTNSYRPVRAWNGAEFVVADSPREEGGERWQSVYLPSLYHPDPATACEESPHPSDARDQCIGQLRTAWVPSRVLDADIVAEKCGREAPYFELKRGETRCGYGLTTEGRLAYGGQLSPDRLVIPYLPADKNAATGVRIFTDKSPGGRYAIVWAIRQEPDSEQWMGLAEYFFDTQTSRLTETSLGEPPAEAWYWSPDGAYLAFLYGDEGWFYVEVIRAANGKSARTEFLLGSQRLVPVWQPEGEVLRWRDNARFELRLGTCPDSACEKFIDVHYAPYKIAGNAIIPVTAGVSKGPTRTANVDGKAIRFWTSELGPPFAEFEVKSDRDRSTYLIDCDYRQFLWTESVEISTGKDISNALDAEWRPLTEHSQVANGVFHTACPEFGVAGIDEIFPLRDVAPRLDGIHCETKCEVHAGSLKLDAERVVIDEPTNLAFLVQGPCGNSVCSALLWKRQRRWVALLAVDTVMKVLPERTNGFADLHVLRNDYSDGLRREVYARYAWNGSRYVETNEAVAASDQFLPLGDQTLPTAGSMQIADRAPVPVALPTTASNAPSDRIELKDGSVLTGEIKEGKATFESSFGAVPVELGAVQSFAEEALRLADGTVLMGGFADGTVPIASGRGNVTIPAKDIVRITRSGAGASTVTPAPRLQAGQGLLTGRALDNFGHPVAGVTVRIAGTNFAVTTDSSGNYRLPYVPGNFTVRLEGAGYDSLEFNLALAQASNYPVADKELFRLPSGPGVYFPDKDGWLRLGECTLEQTSAIPNDGNIDFPGEQKESFSVRGETVAIREGSNPVFLNHTLGGTELSLFRVGKDGEIVTDTRRGGLDGFADMFSDSSAKKNTSGVSFASKQLYPGRNFYVAPREPGVYVFVDRKQRNACFKFQLGEAIDLPIEAIPRQPSDAPTLLVDNKVVTYWMESTGSGRAYFRFDTKGYRNTYVLDCASRRFLWIENLDSASGRLTENAAGAQWKDLNPNSTIANAVFRSACEGGGNAGQSYEVPTEQRHSEYSGSGATIPWIAALRDTPILRSQGVAGISLGDTDRQIIQKLGPPTVHLYSVRNNNGNLLFYRTAYEAKGISLNFYLTADTKRVRSMRIMDARFNQSGVIPEIQGVSIGSTEKELIGGLGSPIAKDEHFTCPEQLGNERRTTTYRYAGISFWVCDANKLVYLIDIP